MTATTADLTRDAAAVLQAYALDDVERGARIMATMEFAELGRVAGIIATWAAVGVAGLGDEVRGDLAAAGFPIPEGHLPILG